MQIEAGKYYRTRDGRKVGPATLRSKRYNYWSLGEEFDACHEGDGCYLTSRKAHDLDLIAEWSEPNTTTAWFLDIPAESSPVRKEITSRTVIVPGLYGIVAVYHEQDQVRVTLTREDGTPDQLEAAARTLQQLAEALREG